MTEIRAAQARYDKEIARTWAALQTLALSAKSANERIDRIESRNGQGTTE
jgi:hypothetical protein